MSTGRKATNVCRDNQLCDRLKTVIDGAVHWVQDISDLNTSTEEWVFLLVDAKTLSTRSIELELFGQFAIYERPENFLLSSLVIARLEENEWDK